VLFNSFPLVVTMNNTVVAFFSSYKKKKKKGDLIKLNKMERKIKMKKIAS
jgi:hypothetical protein